MCSMYRLCVYYYLGYKYVAPQNGRNSYVCINDDQREDGMSFGEIGFQWMDLTTRVSELTWGASPLSLSNSHQSPSAHPVKCPIACEIHTEFCIYFVYCILVEYLISIAKRQNLLLDNNKSTCLFHGIYDDNNCMISTQYKSFWIMAWSFLTAI